MSELHVDITDGIAVLTIDRPHANNSLGGSLLKEFLAVTRSLEDDDDVRVIVTTANVTGGATSWSPGVDFAQLDGKLGPGADGDEMFYDGVMQGDHGLLGVSRQGRRFDPVGHGHWVLQLINNLKKPSIAAINGPVAGGGIGFASLHIYRIGGESTKYKAAFAGLGLGPDLGASWFLPRIVGLPAATELLLADRAITAQRAHEIGFLNEVVPDDDVLPAALRFAGRLAELPPLGQRATVRALRASLENTLEEQLALEWDSQRVAFATEDAAAALNAFKTRTKATYFGR